VTAYVSLEVKHLSREQYKDYGDRLVRAVGEENIRVFYDFPLRDCWLYPLLEERKVLDVIQPATAVPADRYPTPKHMVLSNIVQHSRTQWMVAAAQEDDTVDVLIWLDYAILKQGGWTGKPVTEAIVSAFLDKVNKSTFDDIPFPGIWEKGPISDTGDNWRFCGSTHIIPRKHLFLVNEFYQYECKKFINRTLTVPLDLPIWAAVEQNSTLPFRWYQANHDATQLTAFPTYSDEAGVPKARGHTSALLQTRA
jgi:hypothetical protein